MSSPARVDLDAAFAALADSTRRAVIRELLRAPLRAGELAERVDMSAPALSRHLRVLREAGLIVEGAPSLPLIVAGFHVRNGRIAAMFLNGDPAKTAPAMRSDPEARNGA